ncbi:hypothetical protein BGX31_002625 [Mortierella sp. GBA43]|nr:hypothetical protein BGX31_002625 [Mortierella sp. GBA43]
MNDSTAPATPASTVLPRRLVRQQTPLPSLFESGSDEDTALKIQTASNTAMNRNMFGGNRTLFWDLAGQQDPDNQSESDSESDGDDDNGSDSDDGSSSSSSENDDEQEDEEEPEDREETRPENEEDNDGRERDSSIMDLSSAPSIPSFSFSWPTAATSCSLDSMPSLAMQADKKSKRVRIDPAMLLSKKVRFDESRNKVHLHDRHSTISPPGSPAKDVVRSPSPLPLKSALAKRLTTQASPSTSSGFQLSLENTSQDVMDFASSLTRLMGGSSTGSQDQFLSPPSLSQLSVGSPIHGSSPLRSFSMFKDAPPSPVRPPFLSASYSPPRTSSLSSCWSPTLSDEEDSNDNKEATTSTVPETRPISPLRPAAVQGRATVRFTPRRPRHQPASPSGGAATESPKPRFPALLKREASNASFLDNYPSSLAPEPVLTSASPSTSPRDDHPSTSATILVQDSDSINHAAVAAAVLNMATLPDNDA